MTNNTRSKRQLESLRRIREWHLESAWRAQIEGRGEEYQFHMQYYRLLGAAVTDEEQGGSFTQTRLAKETGTAAADCYQKESS